MVTLEFTDRNLLVRVEQFTVSNQISNLFSNSYYSYEPPKIHGRFAVDTLSNDHEDIQHCLGSPFDKRPKINLFNSRYELLITSVNVDFSEHYYLSYVCDFLAVPTEVKQPPKIVEQNSVWDAANGEFNIKDLMIDNIDLVGQKVIEMIERYENYTPTVDHPTPSTYENSTKADDMAAVLAGTKPAVVIDEIHLSDPAIVLMCMEANARGFSIETTKNFTNTRSLVIGEKYNVQEIVEIMTNATDNNEVNDYFYYQLAKLTGYPNEALYPLINNIKDFGFNSIT